jgi:cytochrome oxidase assembly protein ShyY1
MYRKKLLLSTLSLPLAYVFFSGMDYHRSRGLEKSFEIAKRTKNLAEHPIKLTENLNNLNKELNVRNFNENWAYKPFEITGKFDYSNQAHVNVTKNGVIGYDIIAPFTFYNPEIKDFSTIYVNRGWVDQTFRERFGELQAHNAPGYTTLKGVVSMVHRNKDDKSHNDYNGNNITHIDLDEFSRLHGLKNLVSTNYFLKEINFDSTNSNAFPLTEDLNSLNNFSVTTEAHTLVKRVYTGLSFGLVYANMFFWVCL